MNKRYLLSGTLFQGQCKIKHVETDEYCKHLIRYIHRNPVDAGICSAAEEWPYSDYSDWVAKTTTGHLIRDAFFRKGELYRQFMEEYKKDDNDMLKDLVFNEE
jgi:putative transposase